MSIVAIIGLVLQLVLLFFGRWFKMNDEQKEKTNAILKEVKDVKSISDVNLMFGRINRL